MPRRGSPHPQPPRRRLDPPLAADLDLGIDDQEPGTRLGELMRRAALGLTAALIVARAYWPSEMVGEEHSGGGLAWVAAVLLTLGLALGAMLVGGRTRVRWSWADAAVYLLMFLVGISATRGAERRTAINLAWEWGGLGIAYFLARTLPRTRAESSTLAGALMATAVAVSTYGIYQATVELPTSRAYYHAHKSEALRIAGVVPGSPEEMLFESRLLASNEPTATFALTNSLAGFLVGPAVLGLAVGLEGLRRRADRRGLAAALLLGALPWLLILTCLLMTKSRSAYLGLALASLVLCWRQRGRLPSRTVAAAVIGAIVLLSVMIAAGVSTGRLDRQVLTQATLSFRYRLEYWQGAWSLIQEEPGVFWRGVGPGNFGAGYLKHKLPEASEEIADPHNMALEIWATAGITAALALVAALVLGLRETMGPALEETGPRPRPGSSKDPDAPPARSSWLLLCAGGGWFLAAHLGTAEPREIYLSPRWFALGLGWAWGVLLGLPAWRRALISAAGLGAAALAVAMNLLASGGIGFAPVALSLWLAIALGQNLRDDRPCGRPRDLGGRGPAFGLAVVGAALGGTFFGAITPFWRAEAAMVQAAQAAEGQPPRFQEAIEALGQAQEADPYSARPWLILAEVEFRGWQSRGMPAGDPVWLRIDRALLKAVSPPRNPDSLVARRREAAYARQILKDRGDLLTGGAREWLHDREVNALGHAVALYPTNAPLRAELAEASGDAERPLDAAREAEVALALDRRTPHPDKKLSGAVRERLVKALERWQAAPRP